MNKKSKKEITPYDKFKKIMDAAAGNSTADYEGHGRFWNTLSLDELQAISIYGVRMIAPIGDESSGSSTGMSSGGVGDCCHPRTEKPAKKEESCCHPNQDNPQLTANSSAMPQIGHVTLVLYPGRGQQSGLVKGLKGEFPFDDSQFPRLPFGGNVVSDQDILFVQDWIDAGCPHSSIPLRSSAKPAIDPLTMGKKAHVSVNNVNAYKFGAGELLQRKNAAYLPADEIENLRAAIKETMNLNKFPLDTRSFNAYGKIHGDSCQHGWEEFLPWHRAYLYEFEQQLQDFVPGVSLPYWDWTMPNYNQGLVPSNRLSGAIPDLYGCWISDQALINLANKRATFLPALPYPPRINMCLIFLLGTSKVYSLTILNSSD